MDLVNSVTQNSNNKNVTMENRPPIYNNYLDSNHDDPPVSPATLSMAMQMQAPSLAGGELDSRAESVGASSSAPASAKSQLPDYLKVIGTDPRNFWPKKYRFTREKTPGQFNPMTISQRNFYENNGYLTIDGCNSMKLIDAIRAEYVSANSNSTSVLASEFLADKLVAKNGKLLQYVRCFCDERTMLMTHKLVELDHQSHPASRATPSDGQTAQQRQPLVRDWIHLPFRPLDKVVCAITAIVPLDNVILVVPGTHRIGQCTITSFTQLDGNSAAYSETSHQEKQNKKELFECSPDNLSSLVEKSKKGFQYVNLKPGQTLFYHPGLVHGFSNDLVNFQKRQLASVAYYAAADCEYVKMTRQQHDNDNQEWSQASPLPIGLAHFRDQDPSDYHSWINRPRLLQDLKASL